MRLLDCGADDFVVKPFASAPGCTRSATCGWAWRANLGELTLRLTRREFDLLAFLAQRTGQVVIRDILIDRVWRDVRVRHDRTIDVHVVWLRRKLGETRVPAQVPAHRPRCRPETQLPGVTLAGATPRGQASSSAASTAGVSPGQAEQRQRLPVPVAGGAERLVQEWERVSRAVVGFDRRVRRCARCYLNP